MAELKKMELTSASGASINLEALYQICPAAFTEVRDEKTGQIERKINFTTLRELLGDNAYEGADEEYGFNWVGKRAAQQEAGRPINKTLRPCPDESEDWENTQNLYIEGDNLDVLKLLQKSYLGAIKMIYIDPPYNTGNDFVYRDDFAMSADDYDLQAGNIDELGNRFRKNTDGNARFHSDWCSMIYERLLIARNLLSQDGVIFISIDDNEVDNLRKICDLVFGEQNFIANQIWKSKSGGANDSKYMAVDHEYVLCYAKNAQSLSQFLDRNATVTTSYNLRDERGEYSLDRLDKQSLGYIESLDFPIIGPDGKIYTVEHKNPNVKVARWSRETVQERYNELVFKNGYVYTKNYKKAANIARSLLLEDRFGRTRTGKTDFTAMFEAAYFSAPKPIKLISYLADIVSDKDFTVLDFFSGSATTAHAIMQLNAEDGGNRKFIMVQIPEETDENSDASAAGFKNICEIGKERIRRAGKKIKEESPLTTQNLDTGFRVFKLADSNMEDVYFAPKELQQQDIFALINNVKDGREDLDLLFGCMLDWGVQLSLPLTDLTVAGKKIYNVNDGDLVACFADGINEDVINAIAELNPLRVVFKDSGFESAPLKINLFEMFKQKCGWSEDNVKDRVHII